MKALLEEILDGIFIFLGLLVGLGYRDQLQEAGMVGIELLALALHFVPEAVHNSLAHLVAGIAEVAIDVVVLDGPVPGLQAAAAGYPDRRVGLLIGPGPDIYVA